MEHIQFELTKEFRNRFHEALHENDQDFIVNSLSEVSAPDIAMLLHEFNTEEAKYVIDLLPNDTQALIIRDLDSDMRKMILPAFARKKLAQLINLLESDDAADILNELPIRESEEVILLLDNEHRSQVVDLLRYPENVAGGLMAKELIKVHGDWTVVQCAKEIRKQALYVSKFYTVYVVDDKDKLLGRISLQQLVLSDLRSHVRELVDDELISVETFTEDKEVAQVMKQYDLESLPVVSHGRLVGRITIDDIVDVITEQADEERQMMSGITENVEEDDSVWHNTRARLPWLLIGIIGGILNARLMGVFEKDLARLTAIAFFVPLIQATGGNVGIQSASLVVQSLAGRGFIDASLWIRLGKVLAVAMLNGLFLSLIVLTANMLFFGNFNLSYVVSTSLFGVVIFASIVGTATPLILNHLGINPAIASGPFITTINDLLGLTVYFVSIRLLLS